MAKENYYTPSIPKDAREFIEALKRAGKQSPVSIMLRDLNRYYLMLQRGRDIALTLSDDELEIIDSALENYDTKQLNFRSLRGLIDDYFDINQALDFEAYKEFFEMFSTGDSSCINLALIDAIEFKRLTGSESLRAALQALG